MFNRRHLHAGNHAAIFLALIWLGPILISPGETHRDIDISAEYFGRRKFSHPAQTLPGHLSLFPETGRLTESDL